jgi:hypothetical protein
MNPYFDLFRKVMQLPLPEKNEKVLSAFSVTIVQKGENADRQTHQTHTPDADNKTCATSLPVAGQKFVIIKMVGDETALLPQVLCELCGDYRKVSRKYFFW